MVHRTVFLQVDDPLAPVETLPPAVRGVVAFAVVYLIGRFVVVPAVGRVVRRRNPNNRTVVDAIGRYLHVTVILAAAFVATGAAGLGDVLTGSAIVVAAITIAIGVAGQAVIGNLVSGIFLVADPQFNVDDWISWADGEGSVETIQLRVTRVRTPNNEIITVPNTTLATTAITRPYSREQFRLVARFGVAYDADVDRAMAIIRDGIEAEPDVLSDPGPQIQVEELGEDAVWLHAQFWIGQPSRGQVARVRSAFIRRVKAGLQAAGITISPPSSHELSGRLEVAPVDPER